MNRMVSLLTLVCILPLACAAAEEGGYDEADMRYIDNGTIRLGVNLALGGAITYIAASDGGENLVNNYDWGRQIQMSFFAGPQPYSEKGQQPKEHWAHIGWNPIQAGDDYGNGSKVVDFTQTETSLYVKCIPMQWPLNNVPGECTYETWIELEGNTAQVRCRFVNARSDTTQYGGRHQELPAVYTNGTYYRLMTYRGEEPFTGDELTRIPKKEGAGFPWSYWLATENWAALVNDNDWGLGIYKPDNYLFIGGFAGKEGVGGTHDTPTGYIAPLHTEVIDHNITYDYRYDLIVGSLGDIRGYAVAKGRERGLPDWQFESDRQHWHYRSGADAGWPIDGYLHLDCGVEAISPPTLWHAEDAPVLQIEAAFKTGQTKSEVAWSRYDPDNHGANFAAGNSIYFDIIGDGEFRTYTVDLDSVENYSGAMSYLMFKPIAEAEPGAWVKVKRILLGDKL